MSFSCTSSPCIAFSIIIESSKLFVILDETKRFSWSGVRLYVKGLAQTHQTIFSFTEEFEKFYPKSSFSKTMPTGLSIDSF